MNYYSPIENMNNAIALIQDKLDETRIEYTADEIIFKKDMPIIYLFFVHKGGVKLLCDQFYNREQVHLMGANSFICMSEVFVHQEHLFSAYTFTKTSMKAYKIEQFKYLYYHDSAFSKAVIQYIHNAEVFKSYKVISGFNLPIAARVNELVLWLNGILSEAPESVISLKQRELANYLGISMRTFTRSLKNLVEKGAKLN